MTRSQRAKWTGLLDRRILWRLAALILLVTLFDSLDWLHLRRSLRDTVAVMMSWLGHRTASTDAGGGVFLSVNGKDWSFSPDCTYMDLILMMAPFCWRARSRLTGNALRLLALVVTVSGVNLLRVALAVHFVASGYSMFVAHDLPDMIIYWPCLVVAPILALRSDARKRVGPQPVGDVPSRSPPG